MRSRNSFIGKPNEYTPPAQQSRDRSKPPQQSRDRSKPPQQSRDRSKPPGLRLPKGSGSGGSVLVAVKTTDPNAIPGVTIRPVLRTPRAYMITFHGYGTRLHGSAAGSVHHSRTAYGTEVLPEMPRLAEFEHDHLSGVPYVMSYDDARTALEGVKTACKTRGWELIACHARTTHVHAVVHADIEPEAVLNPMKAYASRRLNRIHPEDRGRRRWSRHGSTRYLWEPEDVEAAINYVLYEQGEPIAVFQKDRESE